MKLVYDGYMTDNIAVSFQYAATADSNIGNKQDGSRNMIELLTDDGKPFMAFEGSIQRIRTAMI